MKKILLSLLAFAATSLTALAQEKDNASRYHDGLPVINQNIEWQRDVYRELDLRQACAQKQCCHQQEVSLSHF